MESILDADLIPDDLQPVERPVADRRYRIIGSIIDSVLMAVPALVVIFAMMGRTTHLTYVIVALFYPTYKVWMEYAYQATLGKQWLGMEVVTINFAKPNLGNILRRNTIAISYSAVTILSHGALLMMDALGESNTGFRMGGVLTAIDVLYYFVSFVDAVLMLRDDQHRALHDHLGGTLVVKR